jgi:nucleoid-associated protein YgaU
MKNTSIRRTAVALALGGLSVGALAVPSANAADLATWEKLAQCESGGNWSINTGNGFYGGLQFTQQSWNGVGMSGSPHTASKEAQIEAGERLLALQGWGAWPACTAKYGLSGAATPTYSNSGAVQSAPAATTSTVVAPQGTVQTPVAPAPATVPAAPAVATPVTPVVEAPAVSADAASTAAVESAPVAPVATEAPAPAVAPVKAPVAASSMYQVVAGDTLSLIASRLGVAGGYQAIADANVDVIYDVNLIFPGQVLTIPGS